VLKNEHSNYNNVHHESIYSDKPACKKTNLEVQMISS